MNAMTKPPPTPGTGRLRPSDHLIRAVLASARSLYHPGDDPADEAVRTWPEDKITPILTRAATASATMTTTGWAAELATTAVADMIVTLGPASAASELL